MVLSVGWLALFFEIGSHIIAQMDLKVIHYVVPAAHKFKAILLPSPPKSMNYHGSFKNMFP